MHNLETLQLLSYTKLYNRNNNHAQNRNNSSQKYSSVVVKKKVKMKHERNLIIYIIKVKSLNYFACNQHKSYLIKLELPTTADKVHFCLLLNIPIP